MKLTPSYLSQNHLQMPLQTKQSADGAQISANRPQYNQAPKFGAGLESFYKSSVADGLSKFFYETFPNWTGSITKSVEKTPILGDITRRVMSPLGNLVFDKFNPIPGLEKNFPNLLIAGPPGGVMLYMLYPLTIGPRALQAIHRAPVDPLTGKKDLIELKDVMVRDVTTITLFFFALSWLREEMLKGLQTAAQLPFVQTASKVKTNKGFKEIAQEILFYDLKDNFTIQNEKNLLSHLTTIKNGGFTWDGVMDAVKNESALPSGKPGLFKGIINKVKAAFGKKVKVETDPALAALRNELAEDLKGLTQHLDTLTTKDSKLVFEEVVKNSKAQALSKKAVETLSKYDTVWQKFMTTNFPEAKSLLGKITTGEIFRFKSTPFEFIGRHAMERTLPMHILSFLFVALALGLAPVQINKFTNIWIYGKRNKEAKASPPPEPKSITPPSLPTTKTPFKLSPILPTESPFQQFQQFEFGLQNS